MKMPFLVKDKISKSGLFQKLLLFLPDGLINRRLLKKIIIEPTNVCNLRCPFCTNWESKRDKGAMKLDDFKIILEKLPRSVEEVTLHFAGEPFLNPDLAKMVKMLKDRNIRVIMSSNGTMPFERYRDAINAGLDTLLIALDGFDSETHEKYRIGSRFQDIVSNIKNMAGIKGGKTKIVIQYLIMRHNEDTISEMKKFCAGLGVDELWLKTTSFNISSNKSREADIFSNAMKYLPKNKKYSRYKVIGDKIVNTDKPKVCPWIWRTVVLWNGDIGICCTDLEGEVIVGNILKDSFNDIWQSGKYAQIRKSVIKQDLGICKNCSIANKPFVEIIKF